MGLDGFDGEGLYFCSCIVSELESEASESMDSDVFIDGRKGGFSEELGESTSGNATFADLGDRLKNDLDMVFSWTHLEG